MATPWSAPRIWVGETVAILASGPSMTAEIAEELRGKCRVIVINDQYKLAPWADLLYAADSPWWKWHQEHNNVLSFKGMKVTINGQRVCPYPEVLSLNNTGKIGFDPDPRNLRTCMNSGYQAMHLAAHMGVSSMLLFGFDMRPVDGKDHNFGTHPEALCSGVSAYGTFIRCMTQSAGEFSSRGISVLNCTRKSALRCFPMTTLENALESLRTDKRNALVSA